MIKYLFLLLPLFIIACSDPEVQVITKQKLVPVVPDAALYICPTVTRFPDTKTLTDIQVARLIAQLYSNNNICKNSLDSIRDFIEITKNKMED